MAGGSEPQQNNMVAKVKSEAEEQQHQQQQQQQQQAAQQPQHQGGGGPKMMGMVGQQRPGGGPPHFANARPGMKRPFTKKENMGNFKRHGGGGGGGGGGHGHPNIPVNQYIGPTTNLQPKEEVEKKFTGRCRLFVGNLTPDINEQEFRKMFEPHGALSEVFLNAQKGFGFVKMDTRANAESARTNLDGVARKGRVLRVRFATHGAAVKVKNLSPYVSNELLELAFETFFGEVERAVVVVDDRGKPTGEGIVEFARKPGAMSALKRCNEGCFMLTNCLAGILSNGDTINDSTLLPDYTYEKVKMLSPPLVAVAVAGVASQ